LTEWLSYNGWSTKTKYIKEIKGQNNIVIARKGNLDVEIAVDMVLMAPHLDHLVLFSGDGDFRRVVEAVQDLGKRVSVVSTIKGSDRVLAGELRRQADNFIELEDIKADIARDATLRVRASVLSKPIVRKHTSA
jgi:uncharacterized LabA/DUF88 family protein